MVIGWQLVLGLLMALLAAPLAGLLVETAPVQSYLTLLIRWVATELWAARCLHAGGLRQ